MKSSGGTVVEIDVEEHLEENTDSAVSTSRITEEMIEIDERDDDQHSFFASNIGTSDMDSGNHLPMKAIIRSFEIQSDIIESGSSSVNIMPDEATASTSLESSIISKGTVIHGSIQSIANLVIQGDIVGDVQCNGKIRLTGTVQGDIIAESLEIEGGHVIGNLSVEQKIILDESSGVNGDISAINMLIAGKVKGNLFAAQSVSLLNSAHIMGDVISNQVQIDMGAILSGFLTIMTPGVEIDPFE